jgi:hypothetical protein
VDNFVDNHPLTSREADHRAGFDKLLFRNAKNYAFKIKDLKIDISAQKIYLHKYFRHVR